VLNVLRKLRESSNMTLTELGKRVGKSKQYIYGLEKGKIRLSYDMAVSLAAVFGKTPDIFLQCESISNLLIEKRKVV
jgi:putative transcriptional regulator